MKILLVFDERLTVDKDKLIHLLHQKSKFIKFDLYQSKFFLPSGLVSKPKSFTHAHSQLKPVVKLYDKAFCFTAKQYNDN